jgi:hypothetical protein
VERNDRPAVTRHICVVCVLIPRQPIATEHSLVHFVAALVPTVSVFHALPPPHTTTFLQFIFINHNQNDACLIVRISDLTDSRIKIYSFFVIAHEIHTVYALLRLPQIFMYQIGI